MLLNGPLGRWLMGHGQKKKTVRVSVSVPVPPVPASLRERLKDHPGHVERLQEVLNHVVQEQNLGAWRPEVAVWALEGRLGSFLAEARTALQAAQAGGDPAGIERAVAAERLMSEIRLKQVWIGDDAFWAYFQAQRETLR